MTTLFYIVPFLFFEVPSYSNAGFIPGDSCGTKQPIARMKTLPPGATLEELQCTHIEDDDSFRTLYKEMSIGMFNLK